MTRLGVGDIEGRTRGAGAFLTLLPRFAIRMTTTAKVTANGCLTPSPLARGVPLSLAKAAREEGEEGKGELRARPDGTSPNTVHLVCCVCYTPLADY